MASNEVEEAEALMSDEAGEGDVFEDGAVKGYFFIFTLLADANPGLTPNPTPLNRSASQLPLSTSSALMSAYFSTREQTQQLSLVTLATLTPVTAQGRKATGDILLQHFVPGTTRIEAN